MDYYESAEGITISKERAQREIVKHGSSWASFVADVGELDCYDAQEVLAWVLKNNPRKGEKGFTMSNNIGYHTRLVSDNKVKVVGGSFGGSIDNETVERLVKAHFTVKIKPSGHGVFIDRKGREVYLYLSVDPLKTSLGQLALKEHRKISIKLQEFEDQKLKEIEDLMASMSADEILTKLQK